MAGLRGSEISELKREFARIKTKTDSEQDERLSAIEGRLDVIDDIIKKASTKKAA